jgi:hypothetical protein
MALVCNICKKEVHLMSFGNGFVGACCNKILYSSADKSQFDMKPEEKKDISMHSFHPEGSSHQTKHS